jgi:hypothetical protein
VAEAIGLSAWASFCQLFCGYPVEASKLIVPGVVASLVE